MACPTLASPPRRRSLRVVVGVALLVAVSATLAMPSDTAHEPAMIVAIALPAIAEPATPPAPPVVATADVDAGEAGTALDGGRASYYGRELAGNRTASGERFDPTDYTAAHRTLPFGTRVRVTHARTGKSVVVRVNDRGPFHAARVIDVSRAAADEIGLTRSGTAEVTLERLPSQRGARG